MPRPAQLQQRHAAAGFDQQHRDAAVVDRHPQPAAGVELERAAHEVSAIREYEYELISAKVDKIISARGGGESEEASLGTGGVAGALHLQEADYKEHLRRDA